MNETTTHRGRFLTDGDRVILLYDDGRIQGTRITQEAPEAPAQRSGAATPTPGLIDAWVDWHTGDSWSKAFTVTIVVPLDAEKIVAAFVKAAGRRWTDARATSLSDENQPAMAYSWNRLSLAEVQELARVAGVTFNDLPGDT